MTFAQWTQLPIARAETLDLSNWATWATHEASGVSYERGTMASLLVGKAVGCKVEIFDDGGGDGGSGQSNYGNSADCGQ